MNKQHIQRNPGLNNSVFSCCGLFAVNSRVYGEKANVLGRLTGLFGTVVLPRFGLAHQFSPYSVPYEWLRDGSKADAEADADKWQATNSAAVSQFNQHNTHNTIGIFAPSVLYRQLVDKRSWKVVDGFTNGRLSRENAASNTQTVERGGRERIPATEPTGRLNEKTTAAADKGSVNYSNGFFTLISMTNAARKKMAGSVVDRLFRNVKVTASKSLALLPGKLPGNTATGTASPAMAANTPYTDTVPDTGQGNTRPMEQAHLSNVLQQESIRRTIKTLARDNSEEQHEHKGQFERLQQQLQKAEQHTHQDMHRLQQSVQELKNVLSARQQPLAFSPPRPPSFYGRLK